MLKGFIIEKNAETETATRSSLFLNNNCNYSLCKTIVAMSVSLPNVFLSKNNAHELGSK